MHHPVIKMSLLLTVLGCTVPITEAAFIGAKPAKAQTTTCTADVRQRILSLSKKAYRELVAGSQKLAARHTEDAVKQGRLHRCGGQKVMGWPYLVKGALAYDRGNRGSAAAYWRLAIRYNREISLPQSLTSAGIHRFFARVKRFALSDDPALSRLDCVTDTECKGDRVCEAGTCVASAGPDKHPRPVKGSARAGKGRRFSDRGTLEVGGALSFQYYNQSEYSFGLSNYIGYFIAPRFVLGLYTDVQYIESDASAWSLGFGAAPGFAYPLGRSAAIFLDAIAGVVLLSAHGAAQVGGEAGLKILVGTNSLLRLSTRVTALIYDGRTFVQVMVLAGFSFFR